MDSSVFNEVSQILKKINEQHRVLHTTIKDMMNEYHYYHILEEECAKIAIENPHTYFESLYFKLNNLIEFKE